MFAANKMQVVHTEQVGQKVMLALIMIIAELRFWTWNNSDYFITQLMFLYEMHYFYINYINFKIPFLKVCRVFY